MARINWLGWGAGLGVAALVYHSSLWLLVTSGWQRADFDYCNLVPLISAYLVWERRAELADMPSRPSWGGLAALLVAVFFLLLGELGGEFLSLNLSFWFALLGLCWTLMGWRKLSVVLFPLCLLLTAFPPPNYLYSRLTLGMQLLSTRLGADFLHMLGIPAFREGNVIDLGFTQLEVVAACSGLRFLIPLLIVGLILIYYFRDRWWKRALLMIATLPLAIVMNGLRIGVTGLLTRAYGSGFAEGAAHDLMGWVMFAVSTAVLLGAMRLLSGRGLALAPPPPQIVGPWAAPRPFLPRLAVGLCLLLAAFGFVRYRAMTPDVAPQAGNLGGFPLVLDGWTGRKMALDSKFVAALHFTDYVQIDYHDTTGRSVDFYVAWYATQSKGESIHSPETCLRGGGWSFERTGAVEVDVPGHGTVRVNRSLLEQSGQRMLAYFWFPARGRFLTNGVELKLHTLLGALTARRTDGALVRLITPLAAGESEEDGSRRLIGFMSQALPVLDTILPGA